MIHETVVTTLSPDGVVHVAPMGIESGGSGGSGGSIGSSGAGGASGSGGGAILLKPFKPSVTLDNVLATRTAVVNFTTDVRVFAGCVTGRRQWPTVAAERVAGVRLASTLAHAELRLLEHHDDPLRPRLIMQRVHQVNHAGFEGFNRAQAAVLEAAVLVSRLGMLEPDKIAREIEYLLIAISKTAGAAELEAWSWLMQAVERHHPGLVPVVAQEPKS